MLRSLLALSVVKYYHCVCMCPLSNLLSSRLSEEAEPLAVLLGEAHDALHLLVRHADLLAKVLDDLRVQRDRLAAQLVELLLADDVAHDDDERRERAAGRLVAEAHDLAARRACFGLRWRSEGWRSEEWSEREEGKGESA